MNSAMKYIIGGVLGVMLGGGIEFERANHETQISTLVQFGAAYGCGRNAGMMYAIKKIKPDTEQMPELSQCSDYRMMWEALP